MVVLTNIGDDSSDSNPNVGRLGPSSLDTIAKRTTTDSPGDFSSGVVTVFGFKVVFLNRIEYVLWFSVVRLGQYLDHISSLPMSSK